MVVIGNKSQVTPRKFENAPVVQGVEKRVLIGAADRAPLFVMRHFTVAPGGYTPEHAHAWEHEVYVLAGRGRAHGQGGAQDVGPGDFIFVPPMDVHQFRNTGDVPLEFICVVPLAGDVE